MEKFVVMSGKGGVGKSTVAANLARKLSEDGKVGVLDCDFHGPSIPQMLGVRNEFVSAEEEGVLEPVKVNEKLSVLSMEFMLPEDDSAVIWRGPMKMKAVQNFIDQADWRDIDYLVVDLPPGTGDEPLSIAQNLENVTGSVIVTTPQDVSVNAVKRSVNFSEKVEIPVLGVVENMSGLKCPDCGEEINVFGKGGGKEMAEELEVPFLGEIPLKPEISEKGDSGDPVEDEDFSSAFNRIASGIKKEI